MKNKQFKLAERPLGLPTRQNWNFEYAEVEAPAAGQMLVKNKYISIDPAMRGWMNDVKSYVPPVAIGEVMRAGSIAKVLESRHPDFKTGEYVYGVFGVQEYALSDGKGVKKIPETKLPLVSFLSVLGMPGLTAYFALLDVGKPSEGETVVISGAAGAVGSIAGQIAKIKGCRAVGIAGGAEKCQEVTGFYGFDACLDYKNEDVRQGLKRDCPNGIDIYFDNVGGDILDVVLTRINQKARIIICGAISQYNNTTPVKGPSNYLSLLVNRARMEGMVVFDYYKKFELAQLEMAGWIMQGKLKSKEHIVNGIDTFPETLLMLFNGENHGKLVIEIED